MKIFIEIVLKRVFLITAITASVGCEKRPSIISDVKPKEYSIHRIKSGYKLYNIYLGEPHDSVAKQARLTYNYEAETKPGLKANQYFDDSVPPIFINGIIIKPVANFYFVKNNNKLLLHSFDVYYSLNIHNNINKSKYKIILDKVRSNFTLNEWGDDYYYQRYNIMEDGSGVTISYSMGLNN